MIVLVAFAVVCAAVFVLLKKKGPIRQSGFGSSFWRGRQLSEVEAAQMVRDRLRADEELPKSG